LPGREPRIASLREVRERRALNGQLDPRDRVMDIQRDRTTSDGTVLTIVRVAAFEDASQESLETHTWHLG